MTWTIDSRIELHEDVLREWVDGAWSAPVCAANIARVQCLADACLDALHGLPVVLDVSGEPWAL